MCRIYRDASPPDRLLEETVDLIRGAIRMHVNGMLEDGELVPEPKTIAEYVVAA